MIQRILNSKNFIAFLLASATGMTLYFLLPFPDGNLFLRLIAVKAPLIYSGAKYSYIAMLFTTHAGRPRLRTLTGLRSRNAASTLASQSWEQWGPARRPAACIPLPS